MFAPDTTVYSTVSSLRNPRRRQRTSSDDSVKLPKAKRQRSVLREDTFGPAAATAAGQDASTIIPGLNPVPNGDTTQKNLALRGPKKAGKQTDRVDGTVILSKNDYYTVSQLPSLPDQIRGADSVPPGSFFAIDQGYALVLTKSHAIVWPYAISASSPSPNDVFTLTIPEPCRSLRGLNPLGVLVSNVTAGPPGLMVIIPTTGKIIYWETVSNAAVLGLVKQKQNGIQTSIPGLLPGEHAREVVNAEPSGIIVVFSSGRVAHIAVRDPQGKAAVAVNFLRSTPRISSGGFLGGIKSVLRGGLWRKEVAAARSGRSVQRGQRDVMVATSTCLLEIWDTHWNNGSTMRTQVDVRNDICEALGQDFVDGGGENGPRILDFICTPRQDSNNQVSGLDTDQSISLFVLVTWPHQPDSPALAVIRVDMSGSERQIVSTTHIEGRNVPSNFDKLKPKLHIPKPLDTAFIIFRQSVIVLSLKVRESPSSQLLMDSYRISESFQDCIQLRNEKQYEILGSDTEDQSDDHKYPGCLVMVRGFGLIRIAALPQGGSDNGFENAQMTAKDKLEQAVFYGTMSGNPLDFVSGNRLDFPPEELEEAALDICNELLRSTSKFIPSSAVSIEQHLRLRAKALDDLTLELIRHGKPLTRVTRWELLWGAEKLAAQIAVWKVEERLRKKKNGKLTYLSRVIELMNEKFKTQYEPLNGENDRVRHWFIHDTYRMQHIIPWIFNAIRDSKGGVSRHGQQLADLVLEASELSLAVLETAFRFRDEHSSSYGLREEPLGEGVLVSGYEGLPEFWTSHGIAYIETGHLLDLELDSCRSWMQQPLSRSEAPDALTIRVVAHNSSRQLRVFGKMHRERVRWLSAQSDPKLIDESKNIDRIHVRQRKWQLFKMAGVGQLTEAISLAEEFHDMSALVELIVELQDQVKSRKVQKGALGDNPHLINEGLEQCKQKITGYFERFGGPWADAFFSRQISVGQPGMLLAMTDYRSYVTQFLRKVPAYSRLGWINDVIGETDYNAASLSLENLAVQQESDLWSQRAEISLAKLCRLAAWEKSAVFEQSNVRDEIKRFDDRAEINTIQELVYEHISPALHGAIDRKAELELAVEHFGRRLVKDRPSLNEVLEGALAKIVAREVLPTDQVVDLLTLMDPVQFLEGEHDEVVGREFYLALRVLYVSGYDQTDPEFHEMLQKLVWRRCMIRDNWEVIGETTQKLDNEVESRVHDTALFRTLTECLAEERLEGLDNETMYRRYSPSEILKWTPNPNIVKARFHPEQGTRILRDLDKETEVLRQYVEKGKLEVWFRELLASAKAIVLGASPQPPTTVKTDHSDQGLDSQDQETLTTPVTSSDAKAKLNWV